ncbi:hypothetical protein FIBSPDRAFT_1050173 [Athelia psychrophila]|uniref:Uncharacterized protein n=1 Tax=Athelia psychrophila TaxID=1759441 RepID=A0A166B3U3_9AGAM|nr:hypothetical protein FIBSPDRAFT_1050173 [Fibularhizoctonia sp. CBS 109695]
MSQAGTSKISVGSLEMRRPATSIFSAKSLELQLVGKLQEANKLANPDHFAALYIPVPKARHKIAMPAGGWSPFYFNISLAVKIMIYRRRRRLHKDAIDAQNIGQGHDFVGRATSVMRWYTSVFGGNLWPYDKGHLQPPAEIHEVAVNDTLDNFDDVYIIMDSLDGCSGRQEIVQPI